MHINTLELADNHIQAEGAKYLVEMLRVNFTVKHLVCRTANLPLEGVRDLQVASLMGIHSGACSVYWTSICFTFRICPITF